MPPASSRPRSKAATEQQLREIAAEGRQEVDFQDNGRRAGQLEEVRFTDIEHLEFDLWQPCPEQPASPGVTEGFSWRVSARVGGLRASGGGTRSTTM